MVFTGMTCPKCNKGTLELIQPPDNLKADKCSLLLGYYKCTKCGATFENKVCPLDK